jgi:hypothetical protein
MPTQDGLMMLAESMVSAFEKLSADDENWSRTVEFHAVAFKTLLWQLVASGDIDAPRRALDHLTEMEKKVDAAVKNKQLYSGIFLASIEIFNLIREVSIAKAALK